jgi:hypothetical protein
MSIIAQAANAGDAVTRINGSATQLFARSGRMTRNLVSGALWYRNKTRTAALS